MTLLKSKPDIATKSGGDWMMHKFGFFLKKLNTELHIVKEKDNILKTRIMLFLELEGYNQYLDRRDLRRSRRSLRRK